ncbi:MAG: 2OG-Fe(II) oxygenase [Lysobacteraceae bacterium]
MTAPSAADRAFHAAFAALVDGRIEAGARALETLAADGHVEAAHELARLHLYRMHPAPDAEAGRRHLDDAAGTGHPGARYTRAVVTAGDADGRWAEDLQAAARAGHPLAWRSLAMLWAAQPEASAQASATRWFALGAGAGDPVALALWRRRAPTAVPVAPTPAAVAAALAEAPPLDVAHATRALPPLRDDEDWRLQEAAFGPEDAAYLQALATPLLEPSQAWDPASGGTLRVPIRTSHDAPIDPLMEDVAMRLLQRRLCGLAGCPAINAEPMVVLRYRPGQEYRLHRDLLPPSTLADPVQGRGGQRVATVLAYLNAVDEGGETDFPRRDVRVAPRAGAALVFRNLRPDGSPDEDSLHAGLPVRRGEKWIATLWIRGGAVRGF